MKSFLIPLALFLSLMIMDAFTADSGEQNVLGSKLLLCNDEPKTGYNRTGFCNVPPNDPGCHAVCVPVTDEFLTYTKSKGNACDTIIVLNFCVNQFQKHKRNKSII